MNWNVAPKALNLLTRIFIAQMAVNLYSGAVDLKWREEDRSEDEKVEMFSNEGCLCNVGPNMTQTSQWTIISLFVPR